MSVYSSLDRHLGRKYTCFVNVYYSSKPNVGLYSICTSGLPILTSTKVHTLKLTAKIVTKRPSKTHSRNPHISRYIRLPDDVAQANLVSCLPWQEEWGMVEGAFVPSRWKALAPRPCTAQATVNGLMYEWDLDSYRWQIAEELLLILHWTYLFTK